MPKYVPKMKFDGSSAIEDSRDSSILVDGIPEIIIGKKTCDAASGGKWFLPLPAYREDGAWFRALKVYSYFGSDFKKSIVLEADAMQRPDPIAYFANNYHRIHPEKERKWKETTEKGTFTKYQDYGHSSVRVLFQVLELTDNGITNTPKIINVPQFRCGQVIYDYGKTVDPITKKPNPVVCDPEGVTMFNIAIKGMEYTVTFNTTRIPLSGTLEKFCDADNLINLDTAVKTVSYDQVIDSLRNMYPVDFDACMQGYPGLSRVMVGGHPTGQLQPETPPVITIPAIQPKVAQTQQENVSGAVQLPVIKPPMPNLPIPSSSAPPKMSSEEALRLLTEQK